MSAFDELREDERGRDAQQPADATLEEAGAAERLASTIGNQAFGQLARQGAGIMPDGRAHPDVEAAIAQTRGGGHGLPPSSTERFGDALGESLQDVRVHTDAHAGALADSVSARAFTVGSDIYFGRGEFDPGSASGERLLAHELTHVVQQQDAPTSGPLVVSQPGDAQENEAERAADELAG